MKVRKKVGRPPKKKVAETVLVRNKLVLPKADMYVCTYDGDITADYDGARCFKTVEAVEEWMRDVDDAGGEYYIYPVNHKVIRVTVDPEDDPPLRFTIRGQMEKN